MTSPYINTVLYTNVTLYPYQMNNDVYQHLKNNLIEDIKETCFGDYGYIVDVYEILEYKINKIEAENTMGSCVYSVKFSCRLCKPLKDTSIICKVDRFNKVLLRCTNGPIHVIITTERINNTVFFRDNNRNLRVKDDNESRVITMDDYVKINIINSTFSNGDTKITAIGFLENIASHKDIENFFRDAYDNGSKFVSYEEYIKSLDEKKEETD